MRARVLVVDDSLSVRKVLEKALEGRDFEVLTAASGHEAIERIERDRPDLVVCDVLLPDRDGYQVCQYVRAHPAVGRIPVLLISGVVNSTVLARAAEVQSSDVMFKPFAADELVRKIDGLLGGRGPDRNGASAASSGVVAAALAPGTPGASAPPPAPAPSPSGGAAGPEDPLRAQLRSLVAAPEVRFAALVDREGFLIEAAGEFTTDAEVAGALAACLTETSEGIGRELGLGALAAMILDFERGLLLVHAVPAPRSDGDGAAAALSEAALRALLAVGVADPAALGKVRYAVKKTIPELARAL